MKALGWLSGLLAALLVALLAFLALARDIPQARRMAEEVGSERLRVDVAISGRLGLTLWPASGVVVEGLDITSPTYAVHPFRLRVDRLRVEIDLGELIRERVVLVEAVRFWDADLSFESTLENTLAEAMGEAGDVFQSDVEEAAGEYGIDLEAIPEIEVQHLDLRGPDPQGRMHSARVDRVLLRGRVPTQVDAEFEVDDRPVDLAMLVERLPDGRLEMREIDLAIGTSHLAGRLRFNPRTDPEHLEAQVHARLLDFDNLLTFEDLLASAEEETEEGEVAAIDQPLDARPPVDLAIDLAFTAERLDLPGFVAEDVELDAQWRAPRLDMTLVGARIASGTALGHLVADSEPAPQPQHVQLDAVVSDMRLGELFEKEVSGLDGTLDVGVNLAMDGSTAREMLAGANGSLQLGVLEAATADGRVALLGRDPLGLMFNIFGGTDGATIHCAHLKSELSDGLGDFQGVIDTPDVTMRGTGEVDLRELTVDVLLKPRPKKASFGSLKTNIRVKGPLVGPEAGPDRASVAKETGKVLAWGILNPLLMVVPFVDLGAKGNPCEVALEEGIDEAVKEEPGVLEDTGDRLRGGVQRMHLQP